MMSNVLPPNSTRQDATRTPLAYRPLLEAIKRNPRSVATAIGGILALAASSVWALRSLGRESRRD